ncbi:protein-glutamate methylesterase/protein-glutamine glutaminase [Legionella worsleiensis]|uniref:Protein-glutamate methylesterase/protein-glutamine glutaminase n=1 Tax=Legionella worsleiensis TaxID=45076 RepID=A0A0W1A4A4_9GAMM|nr:chemotaxis response regulator protein-glutamate methylesterase [Legionella worsleiensis]KTD76199.1 Chemotaxis response regulator protein-glutamate methylesterase [Legionella worsleiensis]STY33225.1 fused chemotaxis regulator; protein-glutamat [Legionella worsleiensis]
MKNIRVLLVDDSALMRRVISDVLSQDPEIEILATAANGALALAKLEQVVPDIIILDIEMPEMNGLETLLEIRKKQIKIPVIMFSSLTSRGAEATLNALYYGANDYVTKPGNGTAYAEIIKTIGEELVYKIKGLVGKDKTALSLNSPIGKTASRFVPGTDKVDIVAIGTSTGGPNALKAVLPQIPADFPVPVVIVQHMPPIFTGILAEGLHKTCKIAVKEAQHGDLVVPGQALIAPGNFHMTLAFHEGRYTVQLNQDPVVNFCRPAVDVLFQSVVHHFGSHTLGVVMTGMGQDGLNGCRAIKEKRGQVLIQDEPTSVVWGMPGSVSKAGLADITLPLDDISQAIIQRVNRKRI